MFENDEPFFRDDEKKTLWVNCKVNWTMNIANAIEVAQPGDELVVINHNMYELTVRAIKRMKPNQNITCKIGIM